MLEINEDKTVRAFSAQYFSFVQHHQYHHSGITSFYRGGTQDPLNCEKNRYITLGLSKGNLEISPFSQSSPSISTEQGGSNSGKNSDPSKRTCQNPEDRSTGMRVA